jgi:hypothetical protein
LGLWRLAGEPLVYHVLDYLAEWLTMPTAELCLVVGDEDGPLAAWVRQALAGRPFRLLALPQAYTIIQVARETESWWAQSGEDVCLVEGCAVMQVRQLNPHSLNEAGITLFAPGQQAGDAPCALYSRSGEPLWQLMSRYPALRHLSELREQLAADAVVVEVAEPELFLPLVEWRVDGWQTSVERLLYANARLLGLGSGSAAVIERSYGEDFTVLPPVDVDESAVIYGAVIGPYTSVAAGATIRYSIVSNSLIGAGVQISHAILDGALIGDGATVSGRAEGLLVGDNQKYSKQ